MKKYLAVLAISFMVVGVAFAQTPREYGDKDDGSMSPSPSEGLSVFTNLAATGVNVEGVPGYIALTGSNGDLWYLYVDDQGLLRIASPAVVATSASPNVVDWSNLGTRVGAQ